MLRVCVDAGHGGDDRGAFSHGYAEDDIALDVALALEGELCALGCRVYMTRRKDRTVSLASRSRHANLHDCDRFVSVHCNAALTAQPSGIETWHFPASRKGHNLAESVQQAMASAFPAQADRGVRAANFAVLRLTNMPAALVELGFITNPRDRRRLTDEHWQQEAARAIARGVVEARL